MRAPPTRGTIQRARQRVNQNARKAPGYCHGASLCGPVDGDDPSQGGKSCDYALWSSPLSGPASCFPPPRPPSRITTTGATGIIIGTISQIATVALTWGLLPRLSLSPRRRRLWLLRPAAGVLWAARHKHRSHNSLTHPPLAQRPDCAGGVTPPGERSNRGFDRAEFIGQDQEPLRPAIQVRQPRRQRWPPADRLLDRIGKLGGMRCRHRHA